MGGRVNPTTIARDDTFDYLWGTNANNDRSIMMTNISGYSRQGHWTRTSQARLMFGAMLIGRDAASTQVRDVFGGTPSHITLISGTYAWRMPLSTVGVTYRGGVDVVDVYANRLVEWRNNIDGGAAVTPASDRYYHGFDNGAYTSGTQFERNPTTALVYVMTGMLMQSESNTRSVPSDAGATLWGLLAANYASIRIYDFTLLTPQGAPVPSAMPRSLSNTTGDYIQDAIIEPIQAQRIEGRAEFQTEYEVRTGTPLTISSIPATAFRTTPGALSFQVAITPATGDIDGLTYTYASGSIGALATEAGTYTLTITASLNVNPSYVAVQTITITATPR